MTHQYSEIKMQNQYKMKKGPINIVNIRKKAPINIVGGLKRYPIKVAHLYQPQLWETPPPPKRQY